MDLERGISVIEFLLLIILGVLLVWIATLEFRFLRFTRTLRMLFTGRTGADLELVLRAYMERMDRTDEMIKAFNERVSVTEHKAPLNVQHVGVVRYNPYADKGSDQSFSVALLDDHGDGVVFSGLHTRADARVYAKPIVGSTSTYALSEEEREAINRAMTGK